MKKKPIYLWVLLILSALISAMSLFGMLSPLPSKEALRAAQKQVAGVSAQQLEDQLNYTYRVAESTHSIFNMVLIVLSAIFGIVLNVIFLAIVFYKMWRQQKALAEEEETEELA